ncbi:hypothetical protein ABIC78_003736 [Novosphingobium sp. 1529]|uniref:hypothetical protein n=1 Tax=Novosphingobium sp. 1529 TaxID=3156424 RepID=UPI003390B3B5
MLASAVQPAFGQERTAVQNGFSLPPNSGKKILIFQPAVRVGAQSTGGLFEPNADWSEKAHANILNALTEVQANFGNSVKIAPEVVGEDAQNVEEHLSLFSAIAQSAIEYQFFVGNRLPTKKRDNKDGNFEWSMGESVRNLPGAKNADYALFIYNRDEFGSTGRKLLQVAAILAVGVAIRSGEHQGYAGLVDLKTGDLVWLNADAQMGGDVRDPDGAHKRVQQLLEDFPGSQFVKTAKK